MNVAWSDQANQDFRQQTKWLNINRGQAAVTRYFGEVTTALDKLEKSEYAEYRLVDEPTNTRKLSERTNRLVLSHRK